MKFPFHITLPFTDPVLIFSLVLFIILLAPIILRKFRLPDLVGLIIAGVIIGPHGLNLLMRDSSIELFGTVGLLYIMFLVGLELDLNEFLKNRYRSALFGAATFLIPFGLGFLVCHYGLHYPLLASVLISIMFSTHTMVAYPIASRLGIARNKAVTIAAGGTMITDTVVLLIFAFITGIAREEIDGRFWLRMIFSLAAFTSVVLWGFPAIGRWFFRNIESEKTSHFIFVLALLFLAGFMAKVSGIDPIIGAFLAGLSLNRLIPRTSPLMNRIGFVGNALFIPFFLISVGMLVDLRVLLRGTEAITIAIVLTVAAISGKWLAAFFTQIIYRLSAVQRKVLFGLSASHAAATLAIILTGYRMGIVDENVLNGTIILILVTCLTASFITEKAGRELAILESKTPPDPEGQQEKILVPVTDPAAIERNLDLAIMVRDPQSGNPIYPVAVVEDDAEAKDKILMSQKMLERAAIHASATDSQVQVLTRIDLNFTSGILRTIKELTITDLILNWDEHVKPADRIFGASWIFGTALDNLLVNSSQQVIISRLVQPLNTFRRIIVIAPPNCEVEPGCLIWITKVKRLAHQIGVPVVFYCTFKSSATLKNLVERTKPDIQTVFKYFQQWDEFHVLAREIHIHDLLIVISARKGTVSYISSLDGVPSRLSRYFQAFSFMVVFPEQNAPPAEYPVISPIRESIDHLSRLGKSVKKVFSGKKSSIGGEG